MKKIVYVTGSRAEYGIMRRLLLRLSKEECVELTIVATGMHCDERYGLTYKVIEEDGLVVQELININLDSSSNASVIKSMAICEEKFGKYFETNKFDAVMLLGDRYEIFSVAVAAAFHNIPIIHLHGGEKTLGNYDEFIRHCITKMSKLHLSSTEEYRKRIIQLGEHPDSVFNIGALGAENALLMDLPSKNELVDKFGALDRHYFMVVFHPETLTNTTPENQINELLIALDELKEFYDFIFIGSNSDTGSEEITIKINIFCNSSKSRVYTSVRPEEYLALNKYSRGLIGNSSSGLIEIPSLLIPTINIGDRQKGRVRGDTVIDCQCNAEEILCAIKKSQTKAFQKKVNASENPYYKSEVLEESLKVIKHFLMGDNLMLKEFYDIL